VSRYIGGFIGGDSTARLDTIFWQVGGKVLVGAGAHMEGILLVKTNILFETESSMNGRVLAQTRCDLQKATITQPAGAADPIQRSLRGGMGSAAP
jgi:hypothetical protein